MGKQRRDEGRSVQGQQEKSQHHNEPISVVDRFFLTVGFFSFRWLLYHSCGAQLIKVGMVWLP